MTQDELPLSPSSQPSYRQPSQAQVKPMRKPRSQAEPKEQKTEQQFKFEVPQVKYTEVIGMTRQKAILHKLLQLPLTKQLEFQQLNIKRSIGILMYGPPGTGKTYLVKAVAGELKTKLCYVKPSSVMSKYVGDSAKRIEELFRESKQEQPCILFFDEAEILLQDRDQISSEGGSQELSAAVGQMLTETSLVHDDPTSCIFMFAATNVPWRIDSAHKRSGRFSLTLYIKSPNFWDRMKLFKLYLGKEKSNFPKYFGTINYFLLSMASSDYSPVDIEKIAKIALINSLEHKKILVTTRSVQKAFWSNEAGKSSLDNWYIQMNSKYLIKKKNKFKSLFSRSYREKEPEKSKMDKGDEEMYKDLVQDVQRHMSHKLYIRFVRLLGRGFP